MGPDYKRPEIAVPENWRNGSMGESIADLGWWQLFEDSTLRELIGAAMVANRDLQLAAARVLDARAQLGIARASQFPQLSAGSSYANERPYSVNSFFLRGLPGHIAPPTGDDLQANFDLTFELELWGRLRATEAARSNLLASEENARIGEAKTEFFPKISLTDMFGVESVSLSGLFSGASRYGTPDPQ